MKNRVNTNKLFENIMGKTNANTEDDDEKRYQVSIYLSKKLDRELSIQGAMKEKGQDKSAITRAGLDIILTLSNEEYAKIKSIAKEEGITPGQVVKEMVAKYL